MADQLQRMRELVRAMVNALGFELDVDTIRADLAQTGPVGQEISGKTALSGALEKDCRALIRVCQTYPHGLNTLHAVLKPHLELKTAWPALECALLAYREALQSVTPSSIPSGQKVYLSYAWGDETPEGKHREQLAEELYSAIHRSGIPILRDKEQIKPGERISAFMKAITSGDVILVVLSNKYLESESCMFELYGIWRHVNLDPNRFLRRVIPFILPDAQLKTTNDCLRRGQFWLNKKQDLDKCVSSSLDAVGEITYANYKLINQFVQHASDMLILLKDKFQPRDFDRQARDGFQEVVDQILAARPG